MSEIEHLQQKPQSLLSAAVKQVLLETIEKESKRALEQGETAYLIDLQNAKKLLQRGAWSVRKDNPYLYFMQECLLGKGGTLEETQKAMRECAEKWRELTTEKKVEYETKAKGLAIYDFL